MPSPEAQDLLACLHAELGTLSMQSLLGEVYCALTQHADVPPLPCALGTSLDFRMAGLEMSAPLQLGAVKVGAG